MPAPAKPRPRPVDVQLAERLRGVRSMRRVNQLELAARMRAAGFSDWGRGSVSLVERMGRQVSVAELVGLAKVLDVPVSDLFDPDRLADDEEPAPPAEPLVRFA